jgi:hypothetical protein
LTGPDGQLRWLAAAGLAACLVMSHAEEPENAYLLVQECFIKGFGQHDGSKVFSRLQPGDPLRLLREPDYPHDVNAVRVQWRGYTLGYLSRDASEGIARQLDFGNRLRARIVRVSRHRDPDRRVEIEIYLPL